MANKCAKVLNFISHQEIMKGSQNAVPLDTHLKG